MSTYLWEYLALGVMAAGVTGIVLLSAAPHWYITILLLLIFAGVMVFTRTWPDRAFYLVCSGELLVIACSTTSLWAGLFVTATLAGIVSSAMGILQSKKDLPAFAAFCCCSILITLLVQVSNHVMPPLLILLGIGALVLLIQSVRMYQFRKNYTGA